MLLIARVKIGHCFFCALAKIVFVILANFLGNDLEEIDTNSMM